VLLLQNKLFVGVHRSAVLGSGRAACSGHASLDLTCGTFLCRVHLLRGGRLLLHHWWGCLVLGDLLLGDHNLLKNGRVDVVVLILCNQLLQLVNLLLLHLLQLHLLLV